MKPPDKTDLGDELSTHRYSLREETRTLVTSLTVSVLGAVFAVIGVPIGLVILAIGVAMAVIGGVIYALAASKHRGDVLVLHENGLYLRTRRGDVRIGWDEVTSVVQRRSSWRSLDRQASTLALISPWLALTAKRKPKNLWTTHIESPRGSIALDAHWDDVEGLATAVRASRRERVGRHAKQRLLKGENVAFGPVTFTPEVVTLAGRDLPIEDLADLVVEQGDLVLRRRPRARVAVADAGTVPDLDIALEIAKWLPKQTRTYR